MMTHDEKQDHLMDGNLRKIGRRLTLPDEPNERQKANWKSPRSTARTDVLNQGVFLMKRHKLATFMTTSAIAASVALLVWLGIAGAEPVSAAMIFESFKHALAKSIWIDIEGIDLGNLEVSGQAYLRRGSDAQGREDDTIYNELHVLLKSDNTAYNDLDCVAVTCQTPETWWHFIRGSGGMGGSLANLFNLGKPKVTPTEDLYLGRQWQAEKEDPVGQFGPIPLALSFGGSGGVTYRFPQEQREFIGELMRMLLSFGDERSSETLIERLQQSAKMVQVRRSEGTDWILIAQGFEPLNGEATEPADSEAWPEVEVRINYNPSTKMIGTTYSDASDPLSTPQQVALNRFMASIGGDGKVTAEEIVAQLAPSARSVQVEKLSDQKCVVHGLGVTVPVTDEDRATWAAVEMPDVLSNLTLRVHYDPISQSVTRAEFTNVAGETGNITLRLNDEEIDPDSLSPKKWKTSRTRVRE